MNVRNSARVSASTSQSRLVRCSKLTGSAVATAAPSSRVSDAENSTPCSAPSCRRVASCARCSATRRSRSESE
uniref:Uncharacterized protein n=1 Tax=uncultured marine virus TaxID=186617 RepID=A0A0F7L5C3_9VIRU|nr:hypothetical protein [uncultured marine virus]